MNIVVCMSMLLDSTALERFTPTLLSSISTDYSISKHTPYTTSLRKYIAVSVPILGRSIHYHSYFRSMYILIVCMCCDP